MEKIVPHIWFDTQAGEAAEFYCSLFPDSRILRRDLIPGTPSGDMEMLSFELCGRPFSAFSAGPYFKPNPSVSFTVSCESIQEVDRLWEALSKGGRELMALGEYDFCPRYSWVEDRFGLSWQLMYSPETAANRRMVPSLLFAGRACEKAREAMEFYASVFPDSGVDFQAPYGPGAAPNAEDFLMYASFRLAGQAFSAMDSALDHGFGFTEGISLMVYCDSSQELDRIWGALSADPEAEQCGWLKDRFGLSWQVLPRELDALTTQEDPVRRNRVVKAMLGMKKLDIDALRRAQEEASPIDDYIAGRSGLARARLEEIRNLIRENAPEAEEKISYQMPTFYLAGNLVHFAAQSRHLGFYPSPSAIEAFKAELGSIGYSKGALRFPYEEPLPREVIAKMVRFRAEENKAAAKKKVRRK
ncbi:MAG: VOC family protein [Spirochaetota bacterium]